VDAITLDGLVAELRPRLVGRHLGRPRLSGPAALSFEVSGGKAARLWLDASRATPGLYWLSRDEARVCEALAEAPSPGRARQALLHARKHLDGARVQALRRVAGERVIVLETATGMLVLSLGAACVLTLFVAGAAVGSLGDAEPLASVPEEAPHKEWDQVSAAALAQAVREARAAGASPLRAVLSLCPGLSPRLARELDDAPESFDSLRARLRVPHPHVRPTGPPDSWRDAELVSADSVSLLPFEPPGRGPDLSPPGSWREAAALFLEARLRGQRFERLRHRALEEARREAARLERLEGNLARDLRGLPDESGLRRDAEVLLASALPLPAGATEVELPDPYEPEKMRRIEVDPALGGPKSADRLFTKARRIERARRQVEARLHDTRTAARAAREHEAKVEAARDTVELPPSGHGRPGSGPGRVRSRPDAASASAPEATADRSRGPRHYLTARGLSILVGRGARENHQLTFKVARPEDLWLHARDVPGAHVILKDPEGRAGAEDLREAAEVAAFFSESGREAKADVHVTRRKHVRPGGGGPGRVTLGHTDTLRVAPRDPEGRLRRR
jgi:hypothetical protein